MIEAKRARVIARALAGGVLAMVLSTSAARAADPRAEPATIEAVVFGGGNNWPFWAAESQGFFAREGLRVRLTPTPTSVAQLENLFAGRFQVAMTPIDNVIASDSGQGEAKLPSDPDLVAFMGGDSGFLHLVAAPGIGTVAELRGRTLSVDALTTAYALVLRKLLADGGLGEGDYRLDAVGGIEARFADLTAGKHPATMLNSPFELMAEAKGFRVLADALDALGGHYQGLVGVARRSWAAGHRAELVGFIRAYARGVEWLHDPANRAEALALYRANLPGTSEADAAGAASVLLDPRRGFSRQARIDQEGVRTAIALRERFGPSRQELRAPQAYYDSSYYAQAMGGAP